MSPLISPEIIEKIPGKSVKVVMGEYFSGYRPLCVAKAESTEQISNEYKGQFLVVACRKKCKDLFPKNGPAIWIDSDNILVFLGRPNDFNFYLTSQCSCDSGGGVSLRIRCLDKRDYLNRCHLCIRADIRRGYLRGNEFVLLEVES